MNREEVDAKVEARLAKELAAKKAKEEEERLVPPERLFSRALPVGSKLHSMSVAAEHIVHTLYVVL